MSPLRAGPSTRPELVSRHRLRSGHFWPHVRSRPNGPEPRGLRAQRILRL